MSKRCIFFNKSQEELIRSIFFNRVNESIIVVSVTKKDEYNSLKCRNVGVELIKEAIEGGEGGMEFMSGRYKGGKLFRDF